MSSHPPTDAPASTTPDPRDQVQEALARLVQAVLPIGVVLGAVAVGASVARSLTSGWRPLYALHAVLLGAVTLLYLLRRRMSHRTLIGALIAAASVDGTVNMLTFGLATNGLLMLGCACIVTSLAFGRRAGLLALGAAVLIWSGVGVIESTGIWALSPGVDEQMLSGWSWVSQVAAGAMVVLVTLTAAHAVQRKLLESVLDVTGRTVELERANAALRREVAQRQKAEGDLAAKDQTFRLLAQHMNDVLFVQDMDLRVLYVSPSVSTMFGYTAREIGQTGMSDWMTPDSLRRAMHDFGKYVEAAQAGPVNVPLMEYEYVRKDGTHFWGELRVAFTRDSAGNLTGSHGILRDVTDRKRAEQEKAGLEEQLRQADKMRAIGQLAGGIAHDFNNQLTGILMGAELVARELRSRPDLLRYVEFIRTSATRSAELTGKLLTFARKDTLISVPTDVHDIVAEVVAILERSVEKTIVLRSKLAAERHVLMADAVQLQNALLNVALNARDSMPAGGSIEFRSDTVQLAAPQRFSAGLAVGPGKYLRVVVADDGTGMDDATRARVFEPFFTTKTQGKGTGLGLAMVYGAVEAHGGAIDVQSAPGRGTSFSIYLPLPEQQPGPSSHPSSPGVEQGRGKVLLVEDEDVVRASVREMLERAGYEVEACLDGEDAVRLFGERAGKFDAVVLDLILPKRSGREVFHAMREIKPDVPVVVISGYSQEGEAGELVRCARTAFVQKPFSSQVLAHELARLLRERGSG